jgi:hypothetical protein
LLNIAGGLQKISGRNNKPELKIKFLKHLAKNGVFFYFLCYNKTMFGLPKDKLKILKQLNSPKKIQDFLNKIPINFEPNGDSFLSPMMVLEKNTCHCMEGAALAALALRVNSRPPLIMDLEANQNDFDHVVAVFKQYGKWGAISKTNHAVLRFREPVYNSIRELALSYFHEYFDDSGRKNLRNYSAPVNLKIFDKRGWMTTKNDIEYIPKYLTEIKHFPILNRKQIMNLRRADKIEIEAGKLTEWKNKKAKKQKNKKTNKEIS